MIPGSRPALRWRARGATGRVLDEQGTELAVYSWGPETNNPYFHPVRHRSPSGSLTNHAPWDHRWHHGLWWSWKFVNDYKFWEDHLDFGGGPHRGLGHTTVGNHAARERADGTIQIRQRLDVIASPTRAVLMIEDREIILHPQAQPCADSWAVDWNLRWTAIEDCECTVTPYPAVAHGGYMGLSHRPARSLAADESLVASGGRRGVDSIHARMAEWAAYGGNIRLRSRPPRRACPWRHRAAAAPQQRAHLIRPRRLGAERIRLRGGELSLP